MAKTTTISAATFKARCLELMDRVKETRESYVITKHGKPVARLVPVQERVRSSFGSMKGTVIEYEGATDPIPGEWFTDPFLNPQCLSSPRCRLSQGAGRALDVSR